VRGGKANRISSWLTSTPQVNSGIRNIVIPGMRIRKMVVTRLTAPRMPATPTTARPMIHRSMPVPWKNSRVDRGAYAVQATAAGPPATKKLDTTIRTPNRYSQYDMALARGKATSAAPIWSGTR